ncbi:PucR family transcriptional regulator [Demetria terragena]|uniref:PucR family transcriptional regulator n=1 Tax=Demetria terragena TaxID=63959 RepID=UPI00035EC9E2|nr:PucR family transcriptional regulator [Demetria terragena]
MAPGSASHPSRRARRLPEEVVSALRAELPRVADDVVADVVAGVESYRDALRGQMGATIRQAVQVALDGFIIIASRESGPTTPRAPALDGAYQLGRGEARGGRTPEALLAAYRIGARTAWRHLSASALDAGIGPRELAEFAELVFLYIDELSDSSAAGHADELASAGRARQRLLHQVARHLIRGASAEVLDDACARADWTPPTTLTAVLCPVAQLRALRALLPSTTLVLDDLADVVDATDTLNERSLLLVPDMHDKGRPALRRATQGRGAVVGPARPWREVRASCDRTLRTAQLGLTGDTDEHLVPLILTADQQALNDLRAAVLRPLNDMRPGTADKLAETLRSWVLHHGRREAVAAELFVHPQTVRYRMTQLREAYGDQLDDPKTMLALTVALGHPVNPEAAKADGGS